MTDQTTWLTPAAHKKLQAEFDELTTTGRRHIEERIAEARSHGDLRENADYDAAKNEQGMMEARIRQLKHLLESAEVRDAADTGKVEVGSIVTVTNGDMTLEVLVATSENRVSGVQTAAPEGPLGTALLGSEVGDQVTYEAPGGTFSYTVESIRPFEG
ncbi:MAG: transcription elongation factor GreA [Acidimicrobiia bacterium]|nr:transcription elongation factor GreA [Acidimicrobiia bacterium]MBT8217943.1 transcription elongation factor GreA [Acidimicrobiia bacterium]NNF09044.1 transcription elongation factor GreA [Acidimicrobiia bacterium]NNL71064.1 transcription elongation factor GreA [Acidimicrobiia bacterium]